MSLYFHLGVSQLALLYLALLLPVPPTVRSYPHSPASLLPTADKPALESRLLQLKAALDDPSDAWHIQPGPWSDTWPEDLQRDPLEPGEEEGGRPWEEEVLLRTQRGDLVAQLLSPFPGGHSPEIIHYQDGGQGEDGGKRNQALTFIAGGLQAVSREKGGFGFRFGRK